MLSSSSAAAAAALWSRQLCSRMSQLSVSSAAATAVAQRPPLATPPHSVLPRPSFAPTADWCGAFGACGACGACGAFGGGARAFGTHRHVWMKVPRGKRRPNRHKDEKFRKMRAQKVLKVKLPDMEFRRRVDRNEVTPDEMRKFMKEQGALPMKPWTEKGVYLSATGELIEAYAPPETDGGASAISAAAAKQKALGIAKKGKSYMAVRKIRAFDDDWDPRTFAELAQDIYLETHKTLSESGECARLHELVTEKAFPEMMHNVARKTVRWAFVKSLAPPVVVHVRHLDVLTKNNTFAQVTVRFHSQQTLAIYDRFGRLIHGSEVVAKDVLEYVVFEKHLARTTGSWRIHGKIVPEWLHNAKPAARITEVIYPASSESDAKDAEEAEKTKAADEATVSKLAKEDDAPTIYDRFGRALGVRK